jgi:alkanesulfonate monooxygenase SsuD/methylene tetrahydromethanopterin reductase-like flavin-dependent oxidoreductase (luciferase family)
MKISPFHFLTMECPEGWTEQDLFDYEVKCVEYAEELGFDGVWLGEHHFRPNVCPSILNLASFVAARTNRIRIGLGILVLPFYDPLRLAEDVAVVDLLSRGRLDVGLGRGYNTMEFDAFSIPMEESRERFFEILDILQQAWTKESVNHDGEYYQINGVKVVPKPSQQPHPPLWIGATSVESVKIAGARGIPFMCDPVQTFDQAADLARLWKSSAEEAGHDTDGVELAALRPMWVAETPQEALDDRPVWVPPPLPEPSQTSGGQQVQDPSQGFEPGSTAAEAIGKSPEEILGDYSYIVGDPPAVVRKLQAYRDIGYSHIIGILNSDLRMPLEKVRRGMELFSREVLPHVQGP